MHIPGMDLDLEVRRKGQVPLEAARRIEKMLRAVLPPGTNGQGRWLLKLDNVPKFLQSCQKHRLEVKLSSEADILLDVAARSSLVEDPVAGTLRLAPGISRYQLLKDITLIIQDLNQSNWQGVLEVESDQPSQGERIPLPLPLPPTSAQKGAAMNDVVQDSLGIQVNLENAQALPPETNKRLGPMLEELLVKAKAPPGPYRFDCKGRYKRFEELVHAHVEVEMGAQPDALIVRLRTRGGQLGSVYGDLYLPPRIGHEVVFQAIQGVLEELNKSRWKDVLDAISPEPPPERPRSTWRPVFSGGLGAPAVPPTPHVPSRREATFPLRPLVASSAPPAPVAAAPQPSPAPSALPTPPPGVTVPPAEPTLGVDDDALQAGGAKASNAVLDQLVGLATTSVTDKAVNREQDRVRFLLAVLDQAPSGVFFWRDTREAQELITGNRIGLSQSLQGLHWITTTDRPGQYRITDTFLRAHAPMFKLTPRVGAEPCGGDKTGDGVVAAKGEQGTAPAAIPAVASPPNPPTPPVPRDQSSTLNEDGKVLTSSVTDLLSQRRAIDVKLRQLLEEQRAKATRLEEELAQVRQEMADIEAALSPVQ